jgi:hypothetical protein
MENSVAGEFLKLLPKHKCGLYLEHNPQKDVYETVAEWAAHRDFDDSDWASLEERQKAIETNEVWTLRWYPNTPVGFCDMHAHSLEALLEAVNRD